MPRSLFTRPTPPPRRRPSRLAFETLEDRLAPSVFIPVTTRRDLVYDDTRGLVFFSTSTGSIVGYDPNQQLVVGGFQVSTKGLNGLDITPDGSALYAGDVEANVLWKVDVSKGLNNPIITALPVPGGANAKGVWDVSIASNGAGLVTPAGGGQVNMVGLATGIDTLSPAGAIQANTNLFRGADRSAILILQGNGAKTPVQAAKLVGGSLVLSGSQTAQFNGNVAGAVSRNGAHYAVTVGTNTVVENSDFTDAHVLKQLTGGDAFDPIRDVLYSIDATTDEIVATNPITGIEKYRLAAGENMGSFQAMDSGSMAVSPDGKRLFYTSPTGAQYVDLPQPSNTLGILSITKPFPSVISAGTPGSFTVQAKDAAGNVLPNYVGTVSIFSSDPAASIPQATYTFGLADQGTHTFTAALNTPGTSQTITASDLFAGKVATQKGIAVGAAGATRDLIPAVGHRDLIFDNARNQLVITFFDGSVGRFDIATQTMVTTPVGVGLAGGDITVDQNFVYIADQTAGLATGYFRKLDLTTGAVTSIPFDLLTAGAGPIDVAIPAGVLALTQGGSGGLDISLDKVVTGDGSGELYRSADRSLIVMRTANAVTRYDPATKKTAASFPGASVESIGVSRNGSLISVGMTAASQPFVLTTIDSKNNVRENLLDDSGGVIYDPLRDVLYVVDTRTAKIVVLDSTTFVEKYRIDLNRTALPYQQLGSGTMAISGDGSRLFLSTAEGVLQFVLGQHDGVLKTLAVTSAYPSITTFNTSGTFTVQAKDAAGDVITTYTGTVTISVNDPAANVPVRTYTFTAADAGTKTFDLTFGTPGPRTITVTGENGVVSTQSVTVNDYGLVKSLAIPERSDQIFDPTRNQTIITGTDGYVYRFDQDTQTLLAKWKVGTFLYGGDVTPDGKFLYVADAIRGFAQGFFRKVDLETGQVTNLPFDAGNTSDIGGAFDVAWTSTGVMFATVRSDGAGTITRVPSFQIDLKTDAVGLGPFGKRDAYSSLYRSGNGNAVLIAEPLAGITLFDTPSKTSASLATGDQPFTHFALSADGKRVASGDGSVTVYDAQLKTVRTFFGTQGGVQFDPTDSNRLVIADAFASEVVVHDVTTGAQLARFPFGEVFGIPSVLNGIGQTSISADGRYFTVSMAEAVRQFDVKGQPGKFAVSGLSGTTKAGESVTVTIAAVDPNSGAVLAGFSGLVRLALTDPNGSYPVEFTLTAADQGQKQVTITFRTAGPQTLTVASPSAALATASATTRVLAGELAKFAVLGLPPTPSADVAYAFTVIAQDVFGNRITVETDGTGTPTAGYFGTVTFGSTDNNSVLPDDYQFTEADNGVREFGTIFRTLGPQTLSVLDVVDTTKQGSADVTVGPAPVVPPPPPPVIPPVVPPIPPVVPPPPPPGPPVVPPPATPVSGPGTTTAVGTGEGVLNQAWTVTAGGVEQARFQPFEPGFVGGVRLAVARGPGFEHVVTVPGPGRFPGVVVTDAVTGKQVKTYQAFESSFTGGMFVSTGDFLREGYDAYVFSPDEGGGPRVQIVSGRTGQVIADFFGIDDLNFRGGARTGVADVNGDGTPDLIVSAGFGGGPRVAVFDGTSIRPGQLPRRLVSDFFVFEPSLRNGVYVAGGDVNGDGFGDLAIGAGPGGAPRTVVLSGVSQLQNRVQPLADFFAGDVNNRGGVRVAMHDVDGDGRADLVTGSGAGGGSRVTVYPGQTLPGSFPAPPVLREFDAIPGSLVGVYVG